MNDGGLLNRHTSVRIRSSHHFAAPPFANFGFKGTLATYCSSVALLQKSAWRARGMNDGGLLNRHTGFPRSGRRPSFFKLLRELFKPVSPHRRSQHCRATNKRRTRFERKHGEVLTSGELTKRRFNQDEVLNGV